MGWDAFSDPFSSRFEEDKPDPAYDDVAKRVCADTGSVDGFLRYGALDCSQCADMLERATGASCWSDKWSKDRVTELAAKADWSFEVGVDMLWAKLSARAFLDQTAALGRGVKFSW